MKLPPPFNIINGQHFYTPDQMREYAAAAYRAGQEEMRERAAKHLIDQAKDADMEWSVAAKDCADYIRALTIEEGNK